MFWKYNTWKNSMPREQSDLVFALLNFSDWLIAFVICVCVCNLRLIEKFVERNCFMGLVPDVGNIPSTDQFLRRAALDAGVSCLHRQHAMMTVLVVTKHSSMLIRWALKSFTTWQWLISPSLVPSTNQMLMPMPNGCLQCCPRTQCDTWLLTYDPLLCVDIWKCQLWVSKFPAKDLLVWSLRHCCVARAHLPVSEWIAGLTGYKFEFRMALFKIIC